MSDLIPQVILLVLLAVGLLALVWRQEDWALEIRFTLAFAALIFLSVAIVAIVMWMQYNSALVAIKLAEAAAITPQARLVMEIGKLNDAQLSALGKYSAIIEMDEQEGVTPILYWPLMGGGRTTKAFIQRIVDMGDAVSLPAIRNLDDADTVEAQALFADFTARGWTQAARGNQPTRWVNRQAAINRIFGGVE